MSTSNSSSQKKERETIIVDRRTLLKGFGTAAVAGSGMAGMSGSASAVETDIEIINFDEVEEGMVEADGSLPVVDELFVFVHGWFGNTGGTPSVYTQTKLVLDSIENAGYSPDMAIGIEWPAFNLWYFEEEEKTEGIGTEVANLIEEFEDSGGGKISLTGHSLGGRIAYWTATKIGSEYSLDVVGAMGAAAYSSTVCPGGMWYDGIADTTDIVRNYHSRDDDVVGTAYDIFGEPLGTEGATCDGASNYTDIDVTSTVRTHIGYLGDNQVGSDLATIIQTE